DARHLHRLGGSDALDLGVCVGAADEMRVGHADQLDIVDIAALARDESLVFLAHDTCAKTFNARFPDPPDRRWLRFRRLSSQAPHWLVSQPTWVLVRLRFSRRRCTSSVRSSTSTETALPFTVSLTVDTLYTSR